MQDVSVERAKKELKTIEIGPHNEAAPAIASGKNMEPYSNFGPDMSGSEDDEASEVRLKKSGNLLLIACCLWWFLLQRGTFCRR